MDLGWKAALVGALAVFVIFLKIRARRHNHEGFRSTHMRRKIRVPVSSVEHEGTPPTDETSP